MKYDHRDRIDLVVLEQTVANEAPSLAVAHILAICLGFFSAHRFYLRRPGSAVFQFLLNCILIGFVWWFVDLFLIPGMVRAARDTIRLREMAKLDGARRDHEAPAQRPPSVDAALVSRLLAERGVQ